MILALGHVVVDELEQALEWLNIAFEERDYRLVLLGAIIPFDKIRNTMRFREIFQEIYRGNHAVKLQ